MDKRLKHLMKELGEAINETLSESDQIAAVIAKIKGNGYDVFLVLEATIGFNKQDDAQTGPQLVAAEAAAEPEFQVSSQDVKFLRSLRISVDDAA